MQQYDTLQFSAGSWRKVAPSLPDVTAVELKVLTYNVWFEDHEFAERTVALLNLIDSSDADFVCLQEVTSPFASALANDPRLTAKYFFPSKQVSSYTVLILAKFPVVFSELSLSTRMGRSLAAAHFKLNGEPSIVSTVHLESLDNARLRKQQLETIFPYISSSSTFSILCGDFNFHHTWPEQTNLQADFVDAWEALHNLTTDPGFTMPANRHFAPWRPDRIMVRSSTWRPISVEIIGREPLAKYQHYPDPTPFIDNIVKTPSDHYGVITSLAV